MRAVLVALFIIVSICLPAFAQPPDAVVIEPSPTLAPPDELEDYTIQPSEAEESFERERDALIEYYNQRMETVEGVITEYSAEAGLMKVKTEQGEMMFAFDEDTRFQVLLREIKPSEVKPGAKMAGLYRVAHNVPYLGRVVIMSDKKVVKRRRHRR